MRHPRDDLVAAVADLLLAPIWITAFALLVKGGRHTGDGFSAGLVAALAVLIQRVGRGRTPRWARRRAPALVAGGLALIVATVFLPLAVGEPPLAQWPPPGQDPPHLGSLELGTAFVFDLGLALLVLGFGVGALGFLEPERGRREARRGGAEPAP